ncbi:MAG: hypothetical protein IKJ25_00815 [Clostridia bacterium]|nr:hypothetical protein [Clostridia bacterium]
MKEKIKKIFDYTRDFVKKNLVSCVCFLLASLVALTGTVSFAKYVSGDTINKRPNAAAMRGSAVIDGVSALSFSNTAFWGGDGGEDDIALNSLRSIDFVINSFETDDEGNRIPTDVRMEYDINFLAPVGFTENLAFQLLAMDGHPVTTQMNLGHFIDSARLHESHVASGKALYNGVDVDHDHTFTFESNAGVIICTTEYKLPKLDEDDPDVTAPLTIRIETVTMPIEQVILFRAWDTSEFGKETIDSEMGELLPPLRASISTMVEMYRISIHLPLFVFEAGEEVTHRYRLTIAPTKALTDDHLGAFIMVEDSDNVGALVSPNNLKQGDKVYFSSIKEKVYNSDTNLGLDASWADQPDDEYPIASMKVYNVGESIEDDDTRTKPYPPIVTPITNVEHSFENSTVTETIYPLTNPDTTDGAAEYILYFRYSNSSYVHQTDYDNENLTARDAYRLYYSNNFYKLEIESITKNTVTTYSAYASGDRVSSGTEKTVKTVQAVDGQNYIVEVVTTKTETACRYTNLTVVKTETVTYTINDYSIYKVNRQGSTYSWREQNSEINNAMSEAATSIIAQYHNNTTDSGPISIPDREVTPAGELSQTITYQKFVRERDNDENNNAILTGLSQRMFDAEGNPYDVIYKDGETLDFFATVDGKEIQVLFLSPCYSKEYPLYTKVTFRQIQ